MTMKTPEPPPTPPPAEPAPSFGGFAAPPERELIPETGRRFPLWPVVALIVAALVIASGIMISRSDLARAQKLSGLCLENLKDLSQAAHIYAEDYQGRFPQSQSWMDQLQPYLDRKWLTFQCPAALDQKYAYAMNSALSRFPMAELTHPAAALFFETKQGRRPNFADTGPAVKFPNRHLGGNNFALAGGGVVHLPGGAPVQWAPK